MVPDPSPTTTADASTGDVGSNSLVNAIIGAVAGVVLSFVPLSTLLGGAVAGYLEGGGVNDGLRVGAYAGLVMLVPFVLVGTLFVMFFLGDGAGGPPVAFGLVAFVVLVLSALYTVGLSVVGGYLGAYVRNER